MLIRLSHYIRKLLSFMMCIPLLIYCLALGQVSNTFYFTFTVNPAALESGLKIRNVVPATEEEARQVLERMDAEKDAENSYFVNSWGNAQEKKWIFWEGQIIR